MPISRMLTAAVVASSVSLLLATAPASAQGATPPPVTSKKVKDRGVAEATPTQKATSGDMAKQQRLALCIDTWDAQTHMSKREWRVACERSVKDYPDAFQ